MQSGKLPTAQVILVDPGVNKATVILPASQW